MKIFLFLLCFFALLPKANAELTQKQIMVGEDMDVKGLQVEILKEHYTFEINEHPIARATGFDHNSHVKRGKRIFSYENLKELVDTAVKAAPDFLDYSADCTAVENQLNCGSCYNMAAMAVVADVMKIKGKKTIERPSYQYGLDCQPSGNFGCGGGTFSIFNAYLSPKGAPTWASYPYTARQGRCKSLPVIASALEWHYVGAPNRRPSDEELMLALDLYGPMAVDIAATNSFIAYRSGIYNACDGRGINHMITLVGYKKGEYWKIKNSWGTGWGEQGFGRIAWKNRSGSACSMLNETAGFVKVKEEAPPAVERQFSMENDQLVIKVTLSKENKLKVDDAKQTLQPFLDRME